MQRIDISDKLVHFTSGVSAEDAFERLRQIADQRALRGSNGKIRGGYPCVCFTEAPLISLQNGLVNPDAYSRYSPFGVMFEKSHIFSRGGRPVIYQRDDEFEVLPDVLKWRHVRYEPDATPPIDFSWEREWRIQAAAFDFGPAHAALVVPNQYWLDRLIEAHDEQETWRACGYSMMLDMSFAEFYCEPFDWTVFLLG